MSYALVTKWDSGCLQTMARHVRVFLVPDIISFDVKQTGIRVFYCVKLNISPGLCALIDIVNVAGDDIQLREGTLVLFQTQIIISYLLLLSISVASFFISFVFSCFLRVYGLPACVCSDCRFEYDVFEEHTVRYWRFVYISSTWLGLECDEKCTTVGNNELISTLTIWQ